MRVDTHRTRRTTGGTTRRALAVPGRLRSKVPVFADKFGLRVTASAVVIR
jgi:hypothetical protein